LLIIAEEVAPPVIMMLLARREKSNFRVAAIHPPEFGHWRKAMLEDIAVVTGGRVISRDLGGSVARAGIEDLGSARQVRVSASKTLITAGRGNEKAIAARREQVTRQYEAAPENVERDKFQERLAKLSGGTALILAGGATPVEQKRRAQSIEDAINATRAAIEEGVVPGGGLAMLNAAPQLDRLIDTLQGNAKKGAQLVQHSLGAPLA
jgi:chaperonin GroEL